MNRVLPVSMVRRVFATALAVFLVFTVIFGTAITVFADDDADPGNNGDIEELTEIISTDDIGGLTDIVGGININGLDDIVDKASLRDFVITDTGDNGDPGDDGEPGTFGIMDIDGDDDFGDVGINDLGDPPEESPVGSIGVDVKALNGTELINTSIGPAYRDYQITITNHAFVDLDLHHVVNLLPQFERLDSTKIPMLTLISPDGDTIGSYAINYRTPDLFSEPGSGYSAVRLLFESYDSDEKPLSLGPAGRNLEGNTVPFTAVITFSTQVDTSAAAAFLVKENTAVFSDNWNKVGVYPNKDKAYITSVLITEDEDLGTDWDGNNDTLYRATSNLAVNLMASSTAPYVGITPYTIAAGSQGSDILTEYSDSSKIEPNDTIAFKLNFGNSTIGGFKGLQDYDVTPIAAGSKLVVELPSGMVYEAIQDGISPAPTPDIYGNFLVWDIEGSFSEGSGLEIYIKVNVGNNYSGYSINAYYIPAQDSEQYFYDDVLRASEEFSKLAPGYYSDTVDMTVADLEPSMHLVRTGVNIFVLGELGVNADLSVTEIGATPENTVSTTGGDRILTLTGGLNEFRYTMNVNAVNNDLKNLTVINRIPKVGDSMVLGGSRGSKAPTLLAGGNDLGDIDISVVDQNGIIDPQFSISDWRIEFFTGLGNVVFSDTDWIGGNSGNIWFSADQMLSVNLPVTAFRVVCDNTNYTLPAGYTLKISATAVLDDLPAPYSVAQDSFAFRGTTGGGLGDTVIVETPTIGVMTGNSFDQAVITIILNDPNDPPRFTGPFNVDLLEAHVDTPTQKSTIETSTFNLTLQNGVWTDSTEIGNLPGDHIYSIKDTIDTPGYSISIQTNPVNGEGGSTIWNFTITCTLNSYRVTYSPNGGTGSQNDGGTVYYYDDFVSVKDRGTVSRTDYTFTGWNTQSNGSGTTYSENQANAFMIKDNTVLYARWQWNGSSGNNNNGDTSGPGNGGRPGIGGNRPTPGGPDDLNEVKLPDDIIYDPDTLPPLEVPKIPGTQTRTMPDNSGDIAKFAKQTGNPIKDIFAGNVPLGNGNRDDCWSFISMILGIVGVLFAITMLFGSSAQNINSGEVEDKTRRNAMLMRIIAIIVGALVLAGWLLLDNLLLPTALVNKWTPYVFAIFIVGVAMVLLQKYTARKIN